jgi:hypothetical protein
VFFRVISQGSKDVGFNGDSPGDAWAGKNYEWNPKLSEPGKEITAVAKSTTQVRSLMFALRVAESVAF